MDDVKRCICHACVSRPRDEHCDVCDPVAGWRSELDAQRLRADTAEAGLAKLRYKAELYDEVWADATGRGYANVTMALCALAAAEQRIAILSKALTDIRENSEDLGACECAADALKDAALNPKPDCCKVSAENQALLNAGEYTPEELFGVGGKPSCPKCFNPQTRGRKS